MKQLRLEATLVTLNNCPVRERSTGDLFASAFRESGENTQLQYDYTLTEEFKPGEGRDRIAMVSWIMKRRLVEDQDRVIAWSERRPSKAQDASSEGIRKWREFRVEFHEEEIPIQPARAWVQVPPAILKDAESLGDFVDYRLVPRLGTVENELLISGPEGILNHPDLVQMPYDTDYADGLMNICNEVEQNAATAQVVIVNSHDYYSDFVSGRGLLGGLQANCNTIIRTRMVEPGSALVGDFSVATRYFHSGRSTIGFGTPPEGLFENDDIALFAEINIGFCLSLPTHVYHMHPTS